jgi:type 1 glutamine amidotransferase
MNEVSASGLPNVLVFTKTSGYRHASISAGVRAVKELGKEGRFFVSHTEDPKVFHEQHLKQFAAVVFLNTTGDVLQDKQQKAFEKWVRAGGGFMGIHSAADTEYDWPFYSQLLGGAHFKSHPHIQKATVLVENRNFPASKMLPERWERIDEWYVFRQSPRETPGVVVLASLDESSYQGGGMNNDHPIAWVQGIEGGRALYTGGGHTVDSYSEDLFRAHLKAGIRWVAGLDNSLVTVPDAGIP